MAISVIPDWIVSLESEDIEFIRKFVLSSGSLKDMAHIYGITYPTVRLRLDRLIQKIQMSIHLDNEPFVALVKRMAIDDKIDFDTARILIDEYRRNEEDSV